MNSIFSRLKVIGLARNLRFVSKYKPVSTRTKAPLYLLPKPNWRVRLATTLAICGTGVVFVDSYVVFNKLYFTKQDLNEMLDMTETPKKQIMILFRNSLYLLLVTYGFLFYLRRMHVRKIVLTSNNDVLVHSNNYWGNINKQAEQFTLAQMHFDKADKAGRMILFQGKTRRVFYRVDDRGIYCRPDGKTVRLAGNEAEFMHRLGGPEPFDMEGWGADGIVPGDNVLNVGIESKTSPVPEPIAVAEPVTTKKSKKKLKKKKPKGKKK